MFSVDIIAAIETQGYVVMTRLDVPKTQEG